MKIDNIRYGLFENAKKFKKSKNIQKIAIYLISGIFFSGIGKIFFYKEQSFLWILISFFIIATIVELTFYIFRRVKNGKRKNRY
jgi:hypothetical protein